MASERADLLKLLESLPKEDRRELFDILRRQFPIHPLEQAWNASAEVILAAIQRGSSLTQRGIRGVIAEAVFFSTVVEPHKKLGWREEAIMGDAPFDAHLSDEHGSFRVQIKMQRSLRGQPMSAKRHEYPHAEHMWIAETQKTRSGTSDSGESTRPYRFSEFDLLGVCLYPSTGDWAQFIYTVADWLIPQKADSTKIATFQPVPKNENAFWTYSIETAIAWWRSGERKRIPIQ